MTTSDVRGLEQLERAVLDDTASLASALRQCLLLAGYAHHEELRAWALKELEGYHGTDELPPHRKVPAALEAESTLHLPGQIIQGNTQRISVIQLPPSARERGIGESAPIRQGVRELEGLIAISDRLIRLSPPGSAEYVLEMTQWQQEHGNESTEFTALNWAIAKPSLESVLDHVRTRLTQFVAEVRAAMPAGQQNPDPNQIDSAAQQALNIRGGDNSTFHITAPNAKADRGGTASANVNEPAPATPQPWWHRTAVIWTAVAAVAAIASVIATVIVAK
ncbi:AbiTii domain-containing protein [Streptomyces clavifer]|uniref:AbiTii domain-containing protein n=1 Tax=Streptomyces clavifer TaxID=68188 RepID=UPI003826DD8A